MFLVKLISLLPFWFLYSLGRLISFFLYHALGYRRKVVRENLSKTFPDLGKKELLRVEKRFYIQFIQVFIESIKAYRFKKKDWQGRVPLINSDLILEYLDKSQPVILLSGHTANWEWPLFPLVNKWVTR